MRVAWSEVYCHPLPKNHRFPMSKYELLPQQLMHEGTLDKSDFFQPEKVPEEVLLMTHSEIYWDKLKSGNLSKSEIRRTGFPYSEQLVQREINIMGGTLEATRFALQDGISMNIAGGTHHAFVARGEGFCLLNDQAIAANYLINSYLIDSVLIIDLDVHQGNGTAEIFRDDPSVFTFSMHGDKNYPLEKEVSDWDIPLPDGTQDREYLQTLEEALDTLFARLNPGFVFYQCGVDILESDRLGRLSVSLDGCRERDRLVLSKCHSHGCPMVASMGGGYSPTLAAIVEAHANTFRLAKQIFE